MILLTKVMYSILRAQEMNIEGLHRLSFCLFAPKILTMHTVDF